MSVESAYDRIRKRIVEHVVGDFASATEAIAFGNNFHRQVELRIGAIKFNQSIGSPDTRVAITPAYDGPTVLKTAFLEADQDKALYIMEVIGKLLAEDPALYLYRGEIRGKPQPQKIEPVLIPRSTTINSIGG